mgnify:CR=1 FL=1
MTVYPGTAMIIPVTPNSRPPMMMIRKISRGCDLTLLEKINGCEKKLSTNCPIEKPIITKMVLGKITELKSAPKLLVMVNIAIRKALITGPR